MKLLYGDNLICGTATMKRLMVIADEIGFMDRPAVGGHALGGGSWGLIGSPSPIRQFQMEDGEVVALKALDPPSELSQERVYASYVEADFENPLFLKTILDGLSDDAFANKFLQLGANYGVGRTGETVRRALIDDQALRGVTLDPAVDRRQMFRIESPEGRLTTLKLTAIEASVRLTTTLLTSYHYGIPPVSDDRIFAKLLAMRTSAGPYVGGGAPLAPYLGFELVGAVIPDEALQQLDVRDILDYRRRTKDAYTAWSVEINRLAAKIGDMAFDKAQTEIPKLIASELMPKLVECRNDMVSARDKLCGDLVKAVMKVHYQIPTLSIAYLTNNIIATGAAFIAAYAPAVAPPVVDYVTQRRAVSRKHAMSYLLGLAKQAPSK